MQTRAWFVVWSSAFMTTCDTSDGSQSFARRLIAPSNGLSSGFRVGPKRNRVRRVAGNQVRYGCMGASSCVFRQVGAHKEPFGGESVRKTDRQGGYARGHAMR